MITRAPVAFIALAVSLAGQEPLKFMGRDVTVTNPGTEDKGGMFPKGPATVCIEGTPRQCFTMPDKIGKNPHVEVMEIRPGLPALFFSAEGGGTSGWAIQLALLRSLRGKYLEDLLHVSLSNQSQHVFWDEPSISNAKIFVTADFEYGPGEAHYSPHRYIISSYLYLPSSLTDQESYYLQDRYMTLKKFDYDKGDILAAEKPEILARLLRVKQQSSGLR